MEVDLEMDLTTRQNSQTPFDPSWFICGRHMHSLRGTNLNLYTLNDKTNVGDESSFDIMILKLGKSAHSGSGFVQIEETARIFCPHIPKIVDLYSCTPWVIREHYGGPLDLMTLIAAYG
jgi:hypothetical protein